MPGQFYKKSSYLGLKTGIGSAVDRTICLNDFSNFFICSVIIGLFFFWCQNTISIMTYNQSKIFRKFYKQKVFTKLQLMQNKIQSNLNVKNNKNL